MNQSHSILYSVTRRNLTRNLTRDLTNVSETSSEAAEISPALVDDAETKRRVSVWLRKIAGALGLDEKRPQMHLRVARDCGLPVSRIENLFSREARRIEAWEYLRIEEAAESAPPVWEDYRLPFPRSN